MNSNEELRAIGAASPAPANPHHGLTALVMRVNDGVCLSDSHHANLRYQEALDWRKWRKGGCSFLLLSAQFRSFLSAQFRSFSISAAVPLGLSPGVPRPAAAFTGKGRQVGPERQPGAELLGKSVIHKGRQILMSRNRPLLIFFENRAIITSILWVFLKKKEITTY